MCRNFSLLTHTHSLQLYWKASQFFLQCFIFNSVCPTSLINVVVTGWVPPPANLFSAHGTHFIANSKIYSRPSTEQHTSDNLIVRHLAHASFFCEQTITLFLIWKSLSVQKKDGRGTKEKYFLCAPAFCVGVNYIFKCEILMDLLYLMGSKNDRVLREFLL